MRVENGRPLGLVPGLIAFFLLLMGAAWVVANPPGAAPDEADHYVKAVGAGGGDLAGRPPSVSKEELEALFDQSSRPSDLQRFLEAARRLSNAPFYRWQQRTAREFSIPAGLGFAGFGCGLGHSDISASCLEQGRRFSGEIESGSLMGTYQPYLYVLPGVAMRSAREPFTAMRLGRLTNAVLSLGLIALAALLLWDRSRGVLSLAGLVVAVTPAVVFSSASLTPSGPEIASGICLAASLMRLARATDRQAWAWPAVAVSGVVLALSRSLGPLFVLLVVVGVSALAGRRRVITALRRGGWQGGAAFGAIAIAMAAGLYWQLSYQPGLHWDVGTLREGIGPGIGALDALAKETVGVFGALDTHMPFSAYVVWWLLLAALLAVAFAAGTRRERRRLVALSVGVVAITVGLATIYHQTGFRLQGRHVLPFAVVLPLWAGELVNRHARRLTPQNSRGLIVGMVVAAAAVHAVAWYANARRFAVGSDGDWLFVPEAEWLPPLGWGPWIVLVLAAAGAYALAGIVAARALGHS